MKEYIQRIYSEMSRLDNKDDNQEDGSMTVRQLIDSGKFSGDS